MLIEDEELRTIFRTTGEEHLQNLDQGLLHLEKYPDDQSTLEALLREAHSLKGDANMLGIKDVGTLSHQIEHLLTQIKQHQLTFSHELGDRLAYAIDALRQMIREAVTDEPSYVNAFQVMAVLMGGNGEWGVGSGELAGSSEDYALSSELHAPTAQIPPVNLDIQPTTSENHVSSSENHVSSSENHVSSSERHVLSSEHPASRSENYVPSLENYVSSSENHVSSSERHVLSSEHPASRSENYVSSSENHILSAELHASGLESHASSAELHASGLKHEVATSQIHSLNSDVQPPTSKNQAPTPKIQSPKTEPNASNSPPTTPYSSLPTPHSPHSPLPTPHLETIRVNTRSLDSLMTQAGELTVTNIRISHRLSEIEAIATHLDEWNHELLNHRLNATRGRTSHESGSSVTQYNNTKQRLERLEVLVANLRNDLYEDSTRLELISDELEDGIRTLRLLPFSTIFNLLPRLVRDLARQEGKQVELVIEGAETRADKRILEEMKDPLMHLLRNAIDHGIESPAERARLGKPATATIYLRSYQTPTHIAIEVQDDGRGLDLDRIKHTAIKRGICREEDLANLLPSQIQALIFSPGFSTAPLVTEVSGRGVGLDVVQTNVEKLKGSIQVESTAEQGCLFRIQLGITLATAHVLIVLVQDIPYAIPVEFIRTARLINPSHIFTLEGRDTIDHAGHPLSIVRLLDLLELPGNPQFSPSLNQQQLACLVLQVGKEQLGILVDEVVDEQDVVIKLQSQLLKRVRNVSGATILGTGEVCMVLNPSDLIKSVQRRSPSASIIPTAQAAPQKQTVLLVEDSIAIRTQEKRMLETAGYEVITAVDGSDGFNKLQMNNVDAIVTDIQMPNMDGLELTTKIRQLPTYSELPIVLVTSLASDEDKRRGAEAGANAYITKSNLNQESLIETLQRLI